jgi:lysophospholipase L1-like esterase
VVAVASRVVVAVVGLVVAASACGGSAKTAAATTTTDGVTTTTAVAAPSTTAPAPATTTGARPAGTSGPYPWQAGPRLDDNGQPMSSWLSEAATVDAQGSSDPGAQLVFLGDSITQGWQNVGVEAWDAVWVPRHPVDFGITGDTTQNVLWRIANGTLKGLNPRAVVLLIGTNDYGAGWSAAQVAQGIEACAAAVRAALPNAALVLLSVFPRDTPTDPAAVAVQATNADLAHVQLPVNTTLVDMTATLSTAEGAPVPSLFSYDLLHPSSEGYELIAGRLLAVPVLAVAGSSS